MYISFPTAHKPLHVYAMNGKKRCCISLLRCFLKNPVHKSYILYHALMAQSDATELPDWGKKEKKLYRSSLGFKTYVLCLNNILPTNIVIEALFFLSCYKCIRQLMASLTLGDLNSG